MDKETQSTILDMKQVLWQLHKKSNSIEAIKDKNFVLDLQLHVFIWSLIMLFSVGLEVLRVQLGRIVYLGCNSFMFMALWGQFRSGATVNLQKILIH